LGILVGWETIVFPPQEVAFTILYTRRLFFISSRPDPERLLRRPIFHPATGPLMPIFIVATPVEHQLETPPGQIPPEAEMKRFLTPFFLLGTESSLRPLRCSRDTPQQPLLFIIPCWYMLPTLFSPDRRSSLRPGLYLSEREDVLLLRYRQVGGSKVRRGVCSLLFHA